MGAFSYKALQRDGSMVEGTIDGSNRGDAMRKIGSRGLQVVSLEESAVAAAAKPGAPGKANPVKTAAEIEASGEKLVLSTKQLIQFTEELSDMLSAGVQLDSAIESISKRSESVSIRNVALLCYEKVREGMSLAAALRSSSKSFSTLYCNLVSAGEISGALSDILKRQVSYLTTMQDLRGKLITAMIYPAFLVLSGIGVSAMFMFFLIPKLERLVLSTGGNLPPIANLLLNTGEFLKHYWIILLVIVAVIVVVFFSLIQTEVYRRRWDEFVLKVPLVGRLLRTRFNVQFVETLSNLLSNGLPLVRSLQLVEGTTANLYIQGRISQITEAVSEGGLLHRAMEKAGTFDPGLIDMVRIGEDTGKLASSMVKAGHRLDREFSRSIDRLGSIIQPLIILIMSLVVGMMAYMMISVIYETISVLRSR